MEGAPASRKRKYATTKSDPGSSGAQSANSNDVDEHWGSEQQTDGSVLSTDTTNNDSYKDWSESRGKRELRLESVDQRPDRQWQEVSYALLFAQSVAADDQI